MQFNYIETMISQSPLDFNYKFGLNDNSPDKFRCNNISIMSKNLNTNSLKSFTNPNFNLNLFDGLDNEDSYEYDISYVSNSFSGVDNLSMLSLDKMDKVKESNDTFNNIGKSLFSSTLNFNNNLNGIFGKSDNLNQGFGLTSNLVNFGLNVYNLVSTIQNSKDTLNTAKDSINAQIDLINEKTEANKEFIQSLKDRQEKNRQKYVSSSNNMI